jgi:hypothetical protein
LVWLGGEGADGSKAVIETSKSDASSAETYPLIKTMMMMMMMMMMMVILLLLLLLLHYKHIILFFYCCTVHSEIHIVHIPTNVLFIKLGKV